MKAIIRVLLHTLSIMVAAYAREPSCPVCSRYDYEERILERVLSNELDMKHMVKEIRETNAKVEAALKMLQEDKTELATALTILTKTQDEMKLNLDNVINGAVSNMSKAVAQMKANTTGAIKVMEEENKKLKGEFHAPTILFRAMVTSSITVSSGQDLVFQQVDVNEGQGYDKGTGKFTAPVAGLYNFVVHYCTQVNQYIYLDIVHNGNVLQRSGHYGVTSYFQGSSMQVYVLMSKGDIVGVRPAHTSHFSPKDCSNTFSGVLIHAG